ncbi:MAG: ATP-binding protein [Blastocatellia bacterium]|nr:ATP-binding protein [Blastocatellia bacterium]MCS7156431.1 ATP-binding protein [Blastocatellia bacterium]MCX7751828.1 ATP-binding protein [Blastocatellia bacterium]MDW8168930.1 ATP-binding protein [Acidobacteriota bacterium]MDW8256690.1 ATP-binding protein [Acidobacteriota bacterium]
MRQERGPETYSISLSIASGFEFVELVERVTATLARLAGFDEETAMWISMAVREAVINAIKHGNKEDRQKRVEIQYAFNHEGLSIRVLDQGSGFDLSQVPNPLDPENLLKPTGRGIFYMKAFMDEVDIWSSPGRGTVVRLRKKMRSESP